MKKVMIGYRPYNEVKKQNRVIESWMIFLFTSGVVTGLCLGWYINALVRLVF